MRPVRGPQRAQSMRLRESSVRSAVHAQPGLGTQIEASESITPALACSRVAGFDHLRAECVPQWPHLPEGLFWKKPESALSWRVGAPNLSCHGEEQYPQRVSIRRELPGRPERQPESREERASWGTGLPSKVEVRPVASGRFAWRMT